MAIARMVGDVPTGRALFARLGRLQTAFPWGLGELVLRSLAFGVLPLLRVGDASQLGRGPGG